MTEPLPARRRRALAQSLVAWPLGRLLPFRLLAQPGLPGRVQPAPAPLCGAAAVAGLAGHSGSAAGAAPAHAGGAFDFEALGRLAQQLAARPFRERPPPGRARALLGYDAIRQIRFRPEHALWRGAGDGFEMQFFPLAGADSRTLVLHELAHGRASGLEVPAQAFDYGGVLPGEPAPAASAAPVAGWKLTWPLNEPGKRDEVISFLGSSYFRALGAAQRYGLSARAVAIDTVGAGAGEGGRGEEFPAFTAFWFERPPPGARRFAFLALLESQSLAGAYRFEVEPGTTTITTVRARLVLRRPVGRLGLAPLSSMFFFGENQPRNDDYRPEVHDSDGLQIETAAGEWIWRPLVNPPGVFVTSFALEAPRGFGLMQRDRAFASYEDPEAHYERRPSAWVQPLGDWGRGRVELLQFNTPDETHDNVAAYWVPERAPEPGVPFEVAWRIRWAGADAPRAGSAHVVQSRRGHGWRAAAKPLTRLQWHIDWQGPALHGLREGHVVPVVDTNAAARVLRADAYPNPGRDGWRLTLDVERLDAAQPLELRAFLRERTPGAPAGLGRTLSETWSYALPPS